jgi:cytochrome c oxidase cbb3-type subunit III
MTNSESNLRRELTRDGPDQDAFAARSCRWSFVILLLLATGCDWMPGKPKIADRWVPDTAITNFAKLYNSECAACHAIDGRLAAAHPMNDPVYLAVVEPALFRNAIANGVPGTTMPAFAQNVGGSLTETQIDLIVSGITARWSQPQDFVGARIPPYSAPRGDVKSGAAAYQVYCAKCHGPDGKGGESGRSVVDSSYLALVSDQGLRTAIIAGRVDLGMPDWRSYVSGRPMSDQEISDVVAWLVSHRKQ